MILERTCGIVSITTYQIARHEDMTNPAQARMRSSSLMNGALEAIGNDKLGFDLCSNDYLLHNDDLDKENSEL